MKKFISIGLCVLFIVVLFKVTKGMYENFTGDSDELAEISKQVDDLEKNLKKDLLENDANVKCPSKDVPHDIPVIPADCPVCPKYPDLSNYVLKSEIPSCPDMSQYVHKKDIPACPDMSQYIHKKDIPPYPDMSQYIKKTDVPPCNCLKPIIPDVPANPNIPVNPMIPADVTIPEQEFETTEIATRTFPDTFVKPKFNLDKLMASNWSSDFYSVKGIGSRKVKKGEVGYTTNGDDIKFKFDKVLPSNSYKKPEKCN